MYGVVRGDTPGAGGLEVRVRIIAGIYGGRKLDAPRGRTTHPMGERVRGAMFNTLASKLPGARVLDAYAGTGVVGFEALSRGAREVVAVEQDRLAQKIIANNMELLDVDYPDYTLFRGRVQSFLSTRSADSFDIIFVDPPYYDYNQHLSTVERIFGLLKPGGLMVISKPGKCEDIVLPSGIVVVDNRSYGEAHLMYCRRKGV